MYITNSNHCWTPICTYSSYYLIRIGPIKGQYVWVLSFWIVLLIYTYIHIALYVALYATYHMYVCSIEGNTPNIILHMVYIALQFSFILPCKMAHLLVVIYVGMSCDLLGMYVTMPSALGLLPSSLGLHIRQISFAHVTVYILFIHMYVHTYYVCTYALKFEME